MEDATSVSPLKFLNITARVSIFLNISRSCTTCYIGNRYLIQFKHIFSPSTLILVDCTWNEFGEYSKCSVSCGQGIQTSVKLLNHTAQNGGKPCEEDSNVLRNTKICSNPRCGGTKIISNMIHDIFILI